MAQSRQRCVDALGESKVVRRDALRLPLARRIQGLRAARTLVARERTQRLAQCQAAVRLVEQRLAGIERDAGKAVLRAEELARLRDLARSGAGGGDFYRTTLSRVSRRFARALVESTLEGQTLYRDAFRMLGVRKTETFNNIGREVGVMG